MWQQKQAGEKVSEDEGGAMSQEVPEKLEKARRPFS